MPRSKSPWALAQPLQPLQPVQDLQPVQKLQEVQPVCGARDAAVAKEEAFLSLLSRTILGVELSATGRRRFRNLQAPARVLPRGLAVCVHVFLLTPFAILYVGFP